MGSSLESLNHRPDDQPHPRPGHTTYRWTDRGLVIESQTTDDYNAIDPSLSVDAQGRDWLAYGSSWSGTEMTQIFLPSGKPATSHPTPIDLVDRHVPPNAVEGAYVLPHGGWYNVFASFDFCCQGVNSSYRVVVGRSRTITGPYVDRTGTSLLNGGLGVEPPGPAHHPVGGDRPGQRAGGCLLRESAVGIGRGAQRLGQRPTRTGQQNRVEDSGLLDEEILRLSPRIVGNLHRQLAQRPQWCERARLTVGRLPGPPRSSRTTPAGPRPLDRCRRIARMTALTVPQPGRGAAGSVGSSEAARVGLSHECQLRCGQLCLCGRQSVQQPADLGVRQGTATGGDHPGKRAFDDGHPGQHRRSDRRSGCL